MSPMSVSFREVPPGGFEPPTPGLGNDVSCAGAPYAPPWTHVKLRRTFSAQARLCSWENLSLSWWMVQSRRATTAMSAAWGEVLDSPGCLS